MYCGESCATTMSDPTYDVQDFDVLESPPILREVLENPYKMHAYKLSRKAHLLRMKWPPTRPYKQRRWNKG